MTAHQKLQLIRHLEVALRFYQQRLFTAQADDVQETLVWVRAMETVE